MKFTETSNACLTIVFILLEKKHNVVKTFFIKIIY